MRRVTSLVLLSLALSPAVAHADVYLDVPVRFLGGPIARPLPLTDPAGAAAGPDGAPIDIGAPPTADAPLVGYPCEPDEPVDCMRWTGSTVDFTPPGEAIDPEDAPLAAPGPEVLPAAPPPVEAAASLGGGLISPAPEAWLPWQRPTLRWAATAGASHYNVQVFRGSRMVMNAWTRTTRLRVPADVLKQGRTYVWVVWTGRGPRRAATYDPTPIGRAAFEVTLRPRLVFRPYRGRPGMTVAEVRPHIPFARLRVTNTFRRPPLRPVPRVVTLTASGRVLLPVTPRVAERLQVALTDRGPAPPIGLRAP